MPPRPFQDHKYRDRTRTVRLTMSMSPALTFMWGPQLAQVTKVLRRSRHITRRATVVVLSLGLHDVWDQRGKNFNITHRLQLLADCVLEEVVALLPRRAHVVLLLPPLAGPTGEMKGTGTHNTAVLVDAIRGAAWRVGVPSVNLFQYMQAVSLGHCVVHNCGHS